MVKVNVLDSFRLYCNNVTFIEKSMSYTNNCLQQMSIMFANHFFFEILFKVVGVDEDSFNCLIPHFRCSSELYGLTAFPLLFSV
jgi:hypothetical protein